jgi:Skp family chaperone for outer membrane proteins
MKKVLLPFFVVSMLLLASATAFAAFDFLGFAQSELLGCVHPTASAEKAKVEYEKEPVQDGDLIKARVKVFYKGWTKNNSMLADIYYLENKNVKLVHAEVLEDTASTGNVAPCKYVNSWQEVK